MAKLAVDLRNVEAAGDFPVYPEGQYTFRVAKAEQGTSKTGNPKLQVQFEIVDGPDGDTDYAGKTMVRSYSLAPKAAAFLKTFILACGLEDAIDDLDDEQLIDAVITARVSQGEYNGKANNEISGESAVADVADTPVASGLQTP